MRTIDWLVFILYFAGVISVGLVQARKNIGVEGFLLGNRRMPWWAVGLSVMATQASAITFIGTTGQAYENGMEFIQVYLPQPLAMVALAAFFIPIFYRARVFTAYEILEKRFDAKTRSLTSFLFLVSRGIGAGIVLYAPAVVLSVIMGWDERVTILIMGALTILYTVVGGIAAVIWTDVLQMLLMFGGIGVSVVVLLRELPAEIGLADVIYIGGVQQMWKSIDLVWDPTNTYTLWSGLIGGLFLALAYFGCDQSQVQRYLTASSLTDSRLSLIFNAFLKVPMQFLILAIGVLLFVFYHFEQPPLIFSAAEARIVQASPHRDSFLRLQEEHRDLHGLRKNAALSLVRARHKGGNGDSWHETLRRCDQRLSAVRESAKELVTRIRGVASDDVNYIFPSYLIHYVPKGILGLMIAVIFAAAMSSLDSELTALSSTTVVDFYRRYWIRQARDQHYLSVSRISTLVWGLFAVAVALYAGQLGSLIEAVNRIGSYFYGSLLGVFLLAFGVRSARGTGAFVGLIAGMFSVFMVSLSTNISWLYYNVIGALTVVSVGSLVSLRPKGGGDEGKLARPVEG